MKTYIHTYIQTGEESACVHASPCYDHHVLNITEKVPSTYNNQVNYTFLQKTRRAELFGLRSMESILNMMFIKVRLCPHRC